MNELNYIGQLSDSPVCKEAESFHDSLISTLERKAKRATDELAAANAALAALKANPEVANILELVKRASR